MSADASLYRFVISGLPDSTFAVLRFQGMEAISRPGWFRLLAISEDHGFDHEEVIGKEAALTILLNGEHQLAGVVCEVHEEPFGPKYTRFEILVRSRLALLECSSHCRVFQKRTAPQILEQVLKDAGFDAKSFKLNLRRTYDPMDLHVQYNETDLDFFQRTAEAWGIAYFEIREGKDVVLVLADDNAAYPASSQEEPLEYRPGAGLVEESFSVVYSLRRTNQLHTGRVRTLGYDYESPANWLKGAAEGPGQGEWTRWDSQVKTNTQATSWSRQDREAFLGGVRDRVVGTSHNPLLRGGEKMALSTTFSAGMGGEYLLIQVDHEGSQEGSLLGNGQDSHYSNTFTAQPCALPFRPSKTTPRPRVAGVLIAKVDGPDGPYAHLDEAGRYRARLPFDEGSSEVGQATPPIRLSQPYAGPGYGLHLPLHKGADLVLAFEDGDIDRPIALGTVPNPSQKSPVASSNKSESTLKTAAGHVFKLDDLEGKTRIELVSAAKQTFILDDNPETKGITLETPSKHRLHIDDKGAKLELGLSDTKHALTIEDEKGILTLKTGSGHVIRMDDDGKCISVQTAKGHSLKLDDDADLLTLQDSKAKHILQIDAGGKIILKTEGDLEFSAKGSLKVKAKDISLEAETKIDAKAGSDFKLQGANVNVKADQKLAVQAGMEAGIKAGTNLKLEGSVNVESKAGVANKMTGTLANLEASGVATIKGAMVMIN